MRYYDAFTAKDFEEQVEPFQDYNRSRNLSSTTLESYATILHIFHGWLVEKHGEDAEITGRRIREFVADRLEAGTRESSLLTYINVLRAFFSFLVLDEVIPEKQNPMRKVRNPRVPQTDVLPLSDEELQAFLAEFDQHSLTERRDYTASLLMVDTGLRAGETVGLSLDSINFEDSSITVVGKGNKKRTVYFGSQMAHILQDYIERCRPWLGNGSKVLFPSAPTKSRTLWMRSSVLSDSIRRKMKEAGVYQRGSSAHRLRHTFAVNFLRNGGGVFHLQELMGHSTLEMTRRYVRFAQADLAEAYKKASPVDALISNPQPS